MSRYFGEMLFCKLVGAYARKVSVLSVLKALSVCYFSECCVEMYLKVTQRVLSPEILAEN